MHTTYEFKKGVMWRQINKWEALSQVHHIMFSGHESVKADPHVVFRFIIVRGWAVFSHKLADLLIRSWYWRQRLNPHCPCDGQQNSFTTMFLNNNKVSQPCQLCKNWKFVNAYVYISSCYCIRLAAASIKQYSSSRVCKVSSINQLRADGPKMTVHLLAQPIQ